MLASEHDNKEDAMKIGHAIDSNGFWTGDVLTDSEETPDVTVLCPDGFHKPKWNGSAWIEGLTQSEIDEIVNRPTPKTPEQKEIEKLKSDNTGLNDQLIGLWETLLTAGVL
jgi:hypothetical protein